MALKKTVRLSKNNTLAIPVDLCAAGHPRDAIELEEAGSELYLALVAGRAG
ncbi:MAG: hypothetical protein U5Q44_15190 [Dehalococcoidia bacterium]|nr:hypothetical protein [Dehalococcoidia bacterium]